VLTVDPTPGADRRVHLRQVGPHVARIGDVLSRARAALQRQSALPKADRHVEAVEVLELLAVLAGQR